MVYSKAHYAHAVSTLNSSMHLLRRGSGDPMVQLPKSTFFSAMKIDRLMQKNP